MERLFLFLSESSIELLKQFTMCHVDAFRLSFNYRISVHSVRCGHTGRVTFVCTLYAGQLEEVLQGSVAAVGSDTQQQQQQQSTA